MSEHVFGPVPSRRLGRSLGVDLVPFKTCSFDCLYCQLGCTTDKTLERRPYIPVREVVDQVAAALAGEPQPDYVTLSGSGEPTLHAAMGEVVAALKGLTTIPVAVLTNGSLMWNEDVRQACAQADLVLPTLAARDEAGFQRIHRPCPGLTLRQHMRGLVAFRREYPTVPMWLELFLLEGLNTSEEDRRAFADLIDQIRPDRVQLNTSVRPTAEPDASAVPMEKLQRWADVLGPEAEVIADIALAHRGPSSATESDVLALCRRRPCTLEQIAAALSVHRNEAAKYVAALRAANSIQARRKGGQEYYHSR